MVKIGELNLVELSDEEVKAVVGGGPLGGVVGGTLGAAAGTLGGALGYTASQALQGKPLTSSGFTDAVLGGLATGLLGGAASGAIFTPI